MFAKYPRRLGVGKLQSRGQIQPTSVFVNEVVLEHSPDTHLYIIYGCFYTAKTVLHSYIRDHMSHKAEHIYSWSFIYRQSLLISVLGIVLSVFYLCILL